MHGKVLVPLTNISNKYEQFVLLPLTVVINVTGCSKNYISMHKAFHDIKITQALEYL